MTVTVITFPRPGRRAAHSLTIDYKGKAILKRKVENMRYTDLCRVASDGVNTSKLSSPPGPMIEYNILCVCSTVE